MNPFEIVLWVLAAAVALVITALALAVAIMIIRAALHTPIGKSRADA